MQSKNEMKLEFDARSINEGFARMAVAAFIAENNPTLDEISDIKTAVSEAVTNAIIHGYDDPKQKVFLFCSVQGNEVEIIVEDRGCEKGDGTFLYHETGAGAVRYGFCIYGGVYGCGFCKFRTGGRYEGDHAEKNRCIGVGEWNISRS